MKLPLYYYGSPVLRKKCQEVDKITDEIRMLVSNMIETMDANNGVGLAASQVGELLRIFVIRPEIKLPDGKFDLGAPEVYINPVLSNPSDEIDIMNEGCLSLPGLHADIERPFSIHIEALDVEGNVISLDATGFKARELMHENDHLNGKLFIDRLYHEDKRAVEPLLRKLKKKYN